jgi:hypothetical protein
MHSVKHALEAEKLHQINSINNYKQKRVFVSLYAVFNKENLLTRQSSLFKRERRGDSQRVIANRLTCQQAL